MSVPIASRSSRIGDDLAAALTALRQGRVVLAVDDVLDTGCDVVALGAAVSVPTVAAMVRCGSGLICATVDARTCDRLNLPPASWREEADRWYVGSMRVGVDAAAGISTGISARDRATTLRVLAEPHSAPGALSRPGHVVPVLAPDLGACVNRPAILAAAARLCGRPGGSVAYCATVREPPGGAGIEDLEPGSLPAFRYSDVLNAVRPDPAFPIPPRSSNT
ncbi:3,4-dihydroxy-2-butanone-4-phosphate synthase [Nocardia sp. NPDC052254]|uniref:3,4-dihydroxy-2-butanone-4-phosphate synthase n=1 Tax=Nocardia sp. NPDC052254 TaxID=3155681 RepID=UPI003427E509